MDYKKGIKKVVEDLKKQTQKDCYEILFVEYEPGIEDDKIGGLPYLPVGEEYPKDKDGNLLNLLLQVNLKNVKLPQFPQSGILEVFMDDNWPCNYVVKIFDEGKEYQKDFSALNLKNGTFVEKAFKIKLKKSKSYLGVMDKDFKTVLYPIVNKHLGTNFTSAVDFTANVDGELEDLILDEIFESYSKCCSFIGGYPNFVQNDPRNDGQDEKEKDVCLFNIDSIYGVNIGDTGVAFGLINGDELKAKNLENVLVDWQCC